MRKQRLTALLLAGALAGTTVLGGCAGQAKQQAAAQMQAEETTDGAEQAADGAADRAEAEGGAEEAVIDTTGFRFHEFSRETETPMGEAGTWTIFLYMCGSDLESENGTASLNLMQIMNMLPSEHVNVIVQTGGAKQWGDTKTWKENVSQDYVDALMELGGTSEAELPTKAIDPEKLQRYRLTDSMELVDEQPLASMGDPETLYDFLSWGVENYPAEHMGVILWDHGGGSLLGACQDELFDGDIMYPFQIEEAFAELAPEMTDRFEFIGFDACLMATVEMANMLAPYARYLYASEEVEPGFGWNYEPFIKAINEKPGIEGAELGEILCNGFMAFYRELEMQDSLTLSVMDLEKIDPVLAALDDVTAELTDLTTDPSYLGPVARETARAERYMAAGMADLGDLAANLGTMMPEEGEALARAVGDAVVYSVSGQARSFATGMAIYYPDEPNLNGVLVYEYSAPTDDYAAYIRNLQSEQFRQHLDGKPLVRIEGEPEHEHDGTYRMDIDPDTLSYMREAGYLLFVDTEGENSILLGSSNDIDIDYETGAVRDSFEGEWAFLEGEPLMLNLDEFFDDYAIYLSPILLNGNQTNLILQWQIDETAEDGGRYVILGTYAGVDPTTGLASRTMRPLRSGDMVQPLYYQVSDENVFSEEDVELSEETASYVGGETVMIGTEPAMERGLLDAEDQYLYQFYVIDIYGSQQTFVPTEMHVGESSEAAAPEDNFYDAVNHEQLAAWSIPEDEASYGTFSFMSDTVDERVRKLIEEAAAEKADPDSDAGRIAALYLTGKDQKARNKGGFGEAEELLSQIREAETVEALLQIAGQFNRDTESLILTGFVISSDFEDSNKKMIMQPGVDTGLSREEWLAEDENGKKAVGYFKEYTQQLFELNGVPKKEAAEKTEAVYAMMQEIAKAGLSLAEMYDAENTSSIYLASELPEAFPGAFTAEMLEEIWGFAPEERVNVTDVGALKKLTEYLKEENLPLLKDYAASVLYRNFASYTTADMLDAALSYAQKLAGQPEKTSEADILQLQINSSAAPYECGRLYVQNYVSEETKTDVTGLIHEVVDIYRKRLTEFDWLGEETRKQAIEKLDAIDIRVAYPEAWEQDLYEAELKRPEDGGLYIDNRLALAKAQADYTYATRHDPVEKEYWVSAPQTVNAYYDPSANSITILSGILQAPFYDPEASREENLGGIGFVIAHEISHAFDTNGAQYDKDGNLVNWWTEEDKETFSTLANDVIEYYDMMGERFERVNGTQTVTENIADLGAMSAVTELAKQEKLDLRELQTAQAKCWAELIRPEYAAQLYLSDTHAPHVLRVNAVLSATDAFYETFGVEEGDGMYVAPEERPRIW